MKEEILHLYKDAFGGNSYLLEEQQLENSSEFKQIQLLPVSSKSLQEETLKKPKLENHAERGNFKLSYTTNRMDEQYGSY